MDDLKERRKYSKLKKETLHCTLRKTRLRRGLMIG